MITPTFHNSQLAKTGSGAESDDSDGEPCEHGGLMPDLALEMRISINFQIIRNFQQKKRLCNLKRPQQHALLAALSTAETGR